MELEIAGIPVRIIKKDIKNMHLYVKPPDGHVEVSAPQHLSDESIAMFVRTRVGWIKKQQERKESTPQQRENYVNEWYRELLKAEIEKRLPKWETLTGLHCSSWQTKYMTTKWGTCNTKTGKIWINLQLAKKPFECLDYVLLHELAHLRVKDHGPEFIAILDESMPYWRDIRKELNDSTLDYLPEAFE